MTSCVLAGFAVVGHTRTNLGQEEGAKEIKYADRKKRALAFLKD